MKNKLTVLVAVSTLAVTACGASEDATADKPTAAAPATATVEVEVDTEETSGVDDTTWADIESAVSSYVEAYYGHDYRAAHELLSERCADAITPHELGVHTGVANSMFGEQSLETFSVDQLVDNLARVSYGVGIEPENQTGQIWVNERDGWFYDAC